MHRRDEFRASKIMLDRARAIENIEFLTPYMVDEFLEGDGPFERIARLRHTETGETEESRSTAPSSPSATSRSREIVDGQVDARRGGLRDHRGPSTRTDRARRVRRRRPRRPHLPPGRSPPPGRAARPRWTPSGTCATRRRSRRPTACRTATSPRPSGLRRGHELAARRAPGARARLGAGAPGIGALRHSGVASK